MVLINSTGLTVASSAIIFLIVTLLLVVLLLVAKHYLVPSGKVKIDINGGKRQLEVETGSSLLGTLHENGVMLSSARAAAVSAKCKCWKVAAESSLPRRCTSLAKSNRLTGV